jgi:hypothetical protein
MQGKICRVEPADILLEYFGLIIFKTLKENPRDKKVLTR